MNARNEIAFISSGTWSLVGTELDAPVINAESTMLLKNVMGLWTLQACRSAS